MVNRIFDYESRRQPLAPRHRFVRRFALNLAAAMLLVGLSLIAGMLGYAYFEGMSRLEAFHNAAMMLGGMGQVDPLKTSAGKIFAGCYALYAGLVVIVAAGLVLAPVAHRILHRFHIGV